jgi:hypothetical protein
MPHPARLTLALLVPLLAVSRNAVGQAASAAPPTAAEAPAVVDGPASAEAPASAVGSICVLRHLLPEQMPYGSPGSLPPTRTYALRLDGGPWVPLSTKTEVLLADIPRARRHTVAIRGDGKPYATFFFRFEPKDPDELCLYQNDLYQWWQLSWTKKSFQRCRCQGIEPSAWQAAHP